MRGAAALRPNPRDRLRGKGMEKTNTARRLPIGAEAVATGGVHFRVWAPRRHRVELVFEAGPSGVELTPEGNGYFSGEVLSAALGPSTDFGSTTIRRPIPILPRASNRRGRTDRPR